MKATIYNVADVVCSFDGTVSRIASCCNGKSHFEIFRGLIPADDDPRSCIRGPFMAIEDEVKNFRPCDGSCQRIEIFLPAEVEAVVARLDNDQSHKVITIQSGWIHWDKLPPPRSS